MINNNVITTADMQYTCTWIPPPLPLRGFVIKLDRQWTSGCYVQYLYCWYFYATVKHKQMGTSNEYIQKFCVFTISPRVLQNLLCRSGWDQHYQCLGSCI